MRSSCLVNHSDERKRKEKKNPQKQKKNHSVCVCICDVCIRIDLSCCFGALRVWDALSVCFDGFSVRENK